MVQAVLHELLHTARNELHYPSWLLESEKDILQPFPQAYWEVLDDDEHRPV